MDNPVRHKITLMAALFAGLGVLTAASAQAGSCTNASYTGIFAFTTLGTFQTPSGTVVLSIVGKYDANGAGRISGSQTASANGQIFKETFTETYTVNPDCTGSSTKISSTGRTIHSYFVITNSLKKIESIQTDPGRNVTSVADKQFY